MPYYLFLLSRFFFLNAELVSIAHNSKCKNSNPLYFHVKDDIVCCRSLEPCISAEDLLQRFLRILRWSSNPMLSGMCSRQLELHGASWCCRLVLPLRKLEVPQVATWKATPFLLFRSGCQLPFVSCASVTGTSEVWGDHDFTCSPFPLLALWVRAAFGISPCLFWLQDLGRVFLFFPVCFPVVLLDSVSRLSLGWRQVTRERN